ncbi:MAG TPA: cysteine--tRNA ligase, partial [Verrucomicrobiae bacterium]
MGLKLFNTLSRSIQEFTSLDAALPRQSGATAGGKKVGMYCCGPTVYDFAHIGNWRTFVFADLVRRYLEFKGHTVTHVMNITDVEDKIIKGVREAKTPLREFTGKYETAFFEDLKTLNCLPPHQTPRATDHIPDIIALIEKLVARGIAYKAADGSVYFSIEKYRGCGCNYGQLLKLNFDEMRAGERVASDEYDKESVADFALWKARVPEDGDVFWPSPFGEGRPGWHIECSAMSMKALGETFDLHLGGEDLKFPHHEDEIAQSEGATGKPFVKFWLHGAFLLVEGKKMSKSLGNFFTLRDLLAKGFTGREIRCLLLTAHYRETFNFTLEGLNGARAAMARIKECLSKLLEVAENTLKFQEVTALPDAAILNKFSNALDDDLNISKAWGVIFEWIRALNRNIAHGKLSPEQSIVAIATWKKLDQVLGLSFDLQIPARITDDTAYAQGIGLPIGFAASIEGEEKAPKEIIELAEQRLLAKKAKDFKYADIIR